MDVWTEVAAFPLLPIEVTVWHAVRRVDRRCPAPDSLAKPRHHNYIPDPFTLRKALERVIAKAPPSRRAHR